MNKYVLHTLCEIKEKYEPVKSKNEEILAKAYEYVEKSLESDKHSMRNWLYAFSLAARSCARETVMYRRIKKELVSIGLYKDDEIAVELNDFLTMGKKAKAIIGPIDYRANIKKEDLENVELIWSDASFLALDDAKHLKSLKCVMGNLVVRDLNVPIPLEVTGGTADLSFVTNLTMLPNYKVALGDVVLDHYSKELPLTDVLGSINIVGQNNEFEPEDFANLTTIENGVYYKTEDGHVFHQLPKQKIYK